jgi:hypothetical protein
MTGDCAASPGQWEVPVVGRGISRRRSAGRPSLARAWLERRPTAPKPRCSRSTAKPVSRAPVAVGNLLETSSRGLAAELRHLDSSRCSPLKGGALLQAERSLPQWAFPCSQYATASPRHFSPSQGSLLSIEPAARVGHAARSHQCLSQLATTASPPFGGPEASPDRRPASCAACSTCQFSTTQGRRGTGCSVHSVQQFRRHEKPPTYLLNKPSSRPPSLVPPNVVDRLAGWQPAGCSRSPANQRVGGS